MQLDPETLHKMSAPKVGELFSDLLTNYVRFGWPFLILHVAVLVLSVWAWWGLFREILHLKRWSRGNASGGSQATRILDQFIAESRELGGQGFLVPITDFSDRLDSIVGGKVTELYERINLFLIVGIAGTLFGVFSFASQAAHILNDSTLASDERIFRLGEALSSSLANAFPVGFVGLVLMFIGQVGVSIWENRLKQTVAAATSKALEQRTLTARSQAQIVEHAAEKIEKAMQPLETLRQTMADSLAPVVKELGGRLELSLELIKQQFGELQETTSRFETAGKTLGESVETLGRNTLSLDRMLAKAPEILDGLVSSQAEHQKVMQVFQENLEKSLQATAAAQDIPAQIVGATQEALASVSRETASTSAAMVAELKQQLAETYKDLSHGLEKQIILQSASLRDTSEQLATHLRTSAETLFAGAKKQTETLDELIQRADKHLRDSLDASQGTISALAGMRQSAEELPSQILATSQSALHEVVQAAVNASNQMADGLRIQINASSELLFQQAGGQAQALREHLDATTSALLTQLSSKSDELLRGIQGQVEAVQTLVVQTTGQLEEINKAARGAVEGLQGLREEAKGSLEASFDKMGEDSGKRWGEMTGKVAEGAQRNFSNFLETMQNGTIEVGDSLKKSAETWSQAAYNAQEMVKGPIVDVFKRIEAELQKAIRNLDNLLAQRYPEVVKDVSAFTQGLQVLLTRAEAVQQGLDRWVVSVEKSEAEMARARERFLESLAEAAPQAAASPEMANLIEGKLDERLKPVRSEISQMGEALEELRRRRDPLAWLPKKQAPSPGTPQVPPTLWNRVRSWLGSWTRKVRS